MEQSQKVIGRKIHKHRRLRDWTLERLAQESGVQIMTISRVERGLNKISYETIAALVNALGLDANGNPSQIADVDKRYLQEEA